MNPRQPHTLARLRRYGVLAALTAATLANASAAAFTLVTQQASGADWNSPAWQPGNLGAATIVSTDAAATFETLPGSRTRSPNNGTASTFPGVILTVSGDSILAPAGSGATTSEIRFKQGGGATGSGAVTFPKLVLNGGQLDTGNDGTIVINGEVDVIKDSSLINDGTNDRGMLINAFLTGTAQISISTYASGTFRPAYTHNINIAGTTNTFQGKWNVVRGALLGSAPGSLGTNDITVQADGALEVMYDMNNPKGNLQLNGRMYLHQNVSLRSVTVGSTPLPKGTYTLDQLATDYPNNFPTSWTPLLGGSVDGTASGSITVLEDNTTPVVITGGVPAALTVQVGGSAHFNATVTGPVLGIQWYSNNVAIPGANALTYTSDALTLAADQAVYSVAISNAINTATASSIVTMTTAPLAIQLLIQEPGGQSWETASAWSDGNPASISAALNADNTYNVGPGTRLRSPDASLDATFPGNTLTISGNSLYVNDPPATALVGEFRFKQGGGASGEGKVTFPNLILKGGQLDTGNDGTVVIDGHIDVAATTHINNNAANDRGYRIDGILTGTNDINLHLYQAAFLPNAIHNFMVAGNSNTFSGKWNVIAGTLVGTGTNSLGTNDITVGVNGALETTYDIVSSGALNLQGQMYLHQNDTFRLAIVGTTPLPKGTYTFDQLSQMFTNFPTGWTAQYGVDPNVFASGSITVLEDNPTPVAIVTGLTNVSVQAGTSANFAVTVNGPVAGIQWYSNNIVIPDATNLTYRTEALAASADQAVYKVVVSSAVNSVNSSATVTVFTTPLDIQLLLLEAIGQSWDTVGAWSDGNPASVSAAANIQNTYTVGPGTRLRSPDSSLDATFPGATLTITGNSVYANDPPAGSAIGEIRFKQGGGASGEGKVTFPNLILKGGQLDTGNDGTVVIDGHVDIAATTHINNNATTDRGYRIDAILTGTNDINLHLYQNSFLPNAIHNFNVAGNSNTFSGKWNVVAGTLIGTGTNSLGTNDITIAADAALETTYDINSSGMLNLQGQMYLHQNDTFRAVTIGTNVLAKGTYTFEQLSATYTNFVSTWTPQYGVDPSLVAGGSITVTGDSSIVVITEPNIGNVQISGGNIAFSFASQLGVNYTIQFKNTITDANWQTLSVQAGTGGTINVSDSLAGGAKFYRISAQ